EIEIHPDEMPERDAPVSLRYQIVEERREHEELNRYDDRIDLRMRKLFGQHCDQNPEQPRDPRSEQTLRCEDEDAGSRRVQQQLEHDDNRGNLDDIGGPSD